MANESYMKQALQNVLARMRPDSPPDGLQYPGNIDVNHRPVIHNDNGSVSTIFSATEPLTSQGEAGQSVLLPTIANGRFMTPNGKMPDTSSDTQMRSLEDNAWNRYKNTNEHLGIFKTGEDANNFADATHSFVPTGDARKVTMPTPAGARSSFAALASRLK